MSDRDERLRRLLRAADAGRDAPELGAAEVTRMRREVLSAVDQASPRAFAGGAWALALVTAALALAVGLALMRPPEAPVGVVAQAEEPVADGASRARPTGSRSPAVSPSIPPAAVASTAATLAVPDPTATAPAASSLVGSSAPAPPRASRAEPLAASTPRRGPAAPSAPRRRPAAPAPARSAPPAGERVATQAPRDPQPYQLQLTAPGGTRIVWILTAPSGR